MLPRALLTALALGAILLPAAALAKGVQSNYGVTIQSCTVNQGGDGLTNGVNIVYNNTHPSPANEVVFVVGYRGHGYTLVDRGTFSQGATINHNLTNALVGLPWAGPVPNRCAVRQVYLNNGKVLGQ